MYSFKLLLIAVALMLISTLSAIGFKDALIKITQKSKNFKIIEKISSFVIWMTTSFIFIYLISIFYKLLSIIKLIDSKQAVVWVLNSSIIFYLIFAIYALMRLIVKKSYINFKDYKLSNYFGFKNPKINKIMGGTFIIVSILTVIYLLVNVDVTNEFNKNFASDGWFYFEPTAVALNPDSVGYKYFDFHNFSVLNLLLKPTNLGYFFQASLLKTFGLTRHFEIKYIYTLVFGYIGWIAFFQSIKTISKNWWVFAVSSFAIVVTINSLPVFEMWDLYKLGSIMTFMSSIFTTSYFLVLIYLFKIYLYNKNKLIIYLLPIMYILGNIHLTILILYVVILLLIIFYEITQQFTKIKIKSVNLFNRNFKLNWLNILSTIAIILWVGIMFVLNKHWEHKAYIQSDLCNRSFDFIDFMCELGSDKQFRWTGSILLIPVFYVTLILIKENYLKLMCWISIIFMILLRFKFVLVYIEFMDRGKGVGASFGLKRLIVYYIFFTIISVMIYLFAKLSDKKFTKYIVFLIPIYLIVTWNGIPHLKYQIEKLPEVNLLKEPSTSYRQSELKFEKFLDDQGILNNVFVALEKPSKELITTWFKYFKRTPFMHRYNDNWQIVIIFQQQDKEKYFNQYDNIFVPETLINKAPANLYKVFKYKTTVKQSAFGQPNNYMWFVRK